jgi:hypothetical protein
MSKGMTILAAKEKQVKRQARPHPTRAVVSDNGNAADSPIGEALRSIYQQTIEEEIPQEFLDILGKLA